MTALLPPLSEQAVADWDSFRATLARGIQALTAAVLVPAALGYLALAGPIVLTAAGARRRHRGEPRC